MARFHSLTLTAAALALLSACDTQAPTGEESEELTNIPATVVKRQSIGNCWVYASVGWAESLRKAHSGEQLNLSESYVSYWHWYEEIAGAPKGLTQIDFLDNGQVSTGGFFGWAGELMARYGVISEGAFIPEEAEAQRSDRQKLALDAINLSLKSGVLSDAAKRKDRKLVRQEMDKAWQLKPEVSKLLDDAFGADVARTLQTSGTIKRVADIQVGRYFEGAVEKNLTLADAIGKPSSSFDLKRRSGKFAWNEEFYPSSASSRRTFLKRVQQAMHARQPVIMTWFVDFNAMEADKAFRKAPATPGRQGGHMTVLEDYEIDSVPGFGSLKAGTLVTDRKTLTAALDPKAKIKFFRIKNSWGGDLAPQQAADEFKGYHDLFLEYLNGPLKECTGSEPNKCATTFNTAGLRAMVLPPTGFITGSSSVCHDTCAFGGPLKTSCGDCAKKVCAADKFCCDARSGNWDAQCLAGAEKLCNVKCPILSQN